MVFKKKKTTRCKSKKQPHWKDLALLLSKKRQLNVVLRRDIIPPSAASISTSEGNDSIPDSSIFEQQNENIPKEDYPVCDKSLLPENNYAGSASGISAGNHPPEFSFKGQLTSSSDTDKTYNVSINDFKSLLVAATKQSDIKLSIQNTNFNLNGIDQISAEDNDSKHKKLRSKKLLKSSIIENTKKEEQHLPEKNTLTRRLRNKYKIQDELQENEFNQNKYHFTIAELEKKPKRRPAETKTDESEQQDHHAQQSWDQVEENNVEDSFLSTYKTKKRMRRRSPKKNAQYIETTQNAREIENLQTEIYSELNVDDDNLNVVIENSTHANETKKLRRQSTHRSKYYTTDTQKSKERSAKTKIDRFKQKDNRLRNRPAKSNAQYKETIKNAREKGSQHEEKQVLEQNIGDNNFNVINESCKHAYEMSGNEAAKLECHAEKNKTSGEPKSIAYELRLLRRKINEVCKSQKQVQAELQSTLNDRFEKFGKTIAACLRGLPRFESQSLEIKLMDVLLEEKRHYMTLDTQSMYSYSNGHTED